MKKENIRNMLIALLWLAMGYIAWMLGVYIFTLGTSELILPATKHLKYRAPQLLPVVHFVLFHAPDFIIIGIVTFLLSSFFGSKKLWLFAFICWPVGYNISFAMRSLFSDLQYYSSGLPPWVLSWTVKSMIVYLVITPFVAWFGSFWGNRWHIRRMQA